MIPSKYALSVIILYILIIDSEKVQCAKNEPKMLFPIFRHGSRSPVSLFPNDPYNKMWNEIGIGELTNVGKAQQLLNGQLTKKRYSIYFGQFFNDSQLYVQTTGISRTVMSAQLFTAGIYPPTGPEVWTNETIGTVWQPIPTYSTFSQVDSPEFEANFLKYFATPNLTVKQNELLKLISNATGYSPSIPYYLLDPFLCESYLNYTLPFGLQPYKNEIQNLTNDIFDQATLPTYPQYAGIVLFDIKNRMDMFYNGSSAAKTVVYSMHDLYVAAVMTALTNQTFGDPPFSSTIYIEVYGQTNNDSIDYVMLWYRPTVYSTVTSYNIINCGFECPVGEFKNIINNLNITST